MFAILKKLLILVSGEVDFLKLGETVAAIEMAGGDHDAVLMAIYNRADVIFPDAVTRPVLVQALKVLQEWYHHPVPASPAIMANPSAPAVPTHAHPQN